MKVIQPGVGAFAQPFSSTPPKWKAELEKKLRKLRASRIPYPSALSLEHFAP